MIRYNKSILVTIAILTCFASPCFSACGGTTTVSGDTYTAYDASYDCVALAVSDAQTAGYNKTVNVPAGTVTWTAQGKITLTKGITFSGAGVGSTVVTAGNGDGTTSTTNAIIIIQPDETTITSNYAIHVTGFEFIHATADLYNIMYIGNATAYAAARNIRVSNCKFLGNASNEGIGIVQSQNVFGVVHANTFQNLTHAWRLIVASTAGWTDDEEWVPGTSNAMYYEDNVLTHDTGCILVSGGRGLRMVARYNTLSSATSCFPNFDIHGYQVAAGIGYELYGNNGTTTAGEFLDHRGGQVFMFGNYWPNDTSGVGYSQRTEWHADYSDGIDANEGTTYKTTALSNYDQMVHWSYYWCNYYDTGGVNKSFLPSSLTAVEDTWQRDGAVNDPLTIVENQSHWVHRPATEFTGAVAAIGSCGQYGQSDCTASGVGAGTLAARPATCTTGVGYWATDQSTTDLTGKVGPAPATPLSGTLYKCTATNTWTAYYTPYTYPHPLRNHPSSPGSGKRIGGSSSGGTFR